MTTQQQAYMLFLSDELLKGMWVPNMVQNESALRARASYELRRQHAEIEALRAGYDAARLEIASLRERVQMLWQLARDVNSRRVTELEAQLAAVGAGGVEPLRKRECLHQIAEPDHFRGATKMVAEADHFAESVISPIDALKAIAVESAVFAEIQKGIDASHPANDGEKARMKKAADRIAKIMELYVFGGNHGQPT